MDGAFRRVDADGRTLLENVHVAGATLAGAVPWREKSGDGISLATGYAAGSCSRRAPDREPSCGRGRTGGRTRQAA